MPQNVGLVLLSFLKMNYYIAGMDSEFAVYSQWRDDSVSHDDSDIMDHRNLADSDLMTIAQVSPRFRFRFSN